MSFCPHYPKFILTDAWGQNVTFSAQGDKFYRERVDTDPIGQVTGERREISKVTFALALLSFHRQVAAGQEPEM
jgi:hypothetical protein